MRPSVRKHQHQHHDYQYQYRHRLNFLTIYYQHQRSNVVSELLSSYSELVVVLSDTTDKPSMAVAIEFERVVSSSRTAAALTTSHLICNSSVESHESKVSQDRVKAAWCL